MKVSENSLTWGMRLYPPLLLQRIWVQKIHKNFRGADIKINRSLFTLNFGRAIFGGTIYSATDPFYAMLFGQILRNKNYHVTVWLKSASIQFLKPARTDLFYKIRITDEMVAEMEDELNAKAVFIKTYPIEVYSKNGGLCAIAKNEIYIRKK
ncbi:MAG: DUF4442 domain-containing protein [Bacteroidota bacterium]